ncbi:hypothetical protein WDW86_08595 [Bdellovibrionota bacterium FG-2]
MFIKIAYQVLVATSLMLSLLQGTAFADDAPLGCKVVRGSYYDATPLLDWNSSAQPNQFPEFKYYGRYGDESVYVIWGVNIGPSASADSRGRFQIWLLKGLCYHKAASLVSRV